MVDSDQLRKVVVGRGGRACFNMRIRDAAFVESIMQYTYNGHAIGTFTATGNCE